MNQRAQELHLGSPCGLRPGLYGSLSSRRLPGHGGGPSPLTRCPMIDLPETLASHCAKAAPCCPRLNVVLLAVAIEVLEAHHASQPNGWRLSG
jgi:hypothetical protein